MLAIAVTAGVGVVLGPVRRASAFLDFIIFDPSALVEHAQQVLQVAEQVRQAAQVVQAGIQELKHFGPAAAPDVATTVGTLARQFDADVYTAARPADPLGQQHPTDLSGTTPDAYAADQARWIAAERDGLAENRRLQNAVEQGMSATTDQVQRLVSASNAVPGETAAAQAHVDMLAVASGELAKLQALRAARSRLRTDQTARAQSEAAYGDAQRAAVRAGWDAPAGSTGTLVPAFGE